MPLLELNNVSKHFGGLQVINNLSFSIEPNEILSLIGPNGAGKTTVLNLITGLYPADTGDILFYGSSLKKLEVHQITRLGIARTFQNLRLFLNMSVIENVMSAAFARTHANWAQVVLRTPGFVREEKHIRQLAEEKLAFFGERLVGYRHNQPAKLLLLDEPAAGMNPNETLEVTELIGKLRDELNLTIILIEHDMSVVGGISDRVIALDHGEKIAEGKYEAVATDPAVIEAYLGHSRKGDRKAW
jgi:branched-chain amino acid transport system ATP-binding protein